MWWLHVRLWLIDSRGNGPREVVPDIWWKQEENQGTACQSAKGKTHWRRKQKWRRYKFKLRLNRRKRSKDIGNIHKLALWSTPICEYNSERVGVRHEIGNGRT